MCNKIFNFFRLHSNPGTKKHSLIITGLVILTKKSPKEPLMHKKHGGHIFSEFRIIHNSINQFLKYFSNWKLLAKLWRNVGTKILELVLLPYVSKKLWLLWMLTKINLDLLLPFKFNPSLPWIEDAFQTDHSAMLWSMQGVFCTDKDKSLWKWFFLCS